MLDPALLAPERIRPLLRSEYVSLIDAGAFADERVELLRGVLVEMSPQGEPHARITAWLHAVLCKALPIDQYEVRSHSPFAATNDSMPEPDVSVSLRSAGGPSADNTLLLIEVAGSSLTKDRVIKTEIYAEAGVPEYWIVDLRTASVEVLARPTAAGYTRTARWETGALRPRHQRLRAVAIEIDDIPWTAPPQRPKRRKRRS